MFSCSEKEELKIKNLKVPNLCFPSDLCKDVNYNLSLKWESANLLESVVVKYDIYIGTKAELTKDDLKSENQLTLELKIKLKANTQYYWKVLAKSNGGETSVSKVCTFTTASLLAADIKNLFPSDKAKDLPITFDIKWDAPDNADNKDLIYTLYVGSKMSLSDIDIKAKEIKETNYSVSLEKSIQYFWKLDIKDSKGAICTTSVLSFSTGNNTISMPNLLFPLDGAKDVVKQINLKWSKSINPDKKLVKYNVLLGKTNILDKSNKINKEPITVCELAVALDSHSKYFWKIEVLEGEDIAFNSSISSFVVSNSSPSKPVIINPSAVKKAAVIELPLSWSPALDTDKDDVKYDVYFTNNEEFTDADKIAKDLSNCSYTVASIMYGVNYKIKIVAKDAFGGSTSSKVISCSFVESKSKISLTSFRILRLEENAAGVPISIEWEFAGKGVKYDLLFSKTKDFSKPIVSMLDLLAIKTSLFFADNIEDGSKIYARVIAKDDSGKKLDSDPFSFIYKRFGMFTDLRDGRVYKTVSINGKIWLAENFAYIPYVESDEFYDRMCSVYDFDINKNKSLEDLKASPYYKKYGVMYSWAMLQDVIPNGWHVATDQDWKDVEKEGGIDDVSLNQTRVYRGITAEVFKSKEEWNPAGTNSMGLNFLPSGACELQDGFLNERIYLWTGTEKSSLSAYYRTLANNKNGIYRNTGFKIRRYYVRLVKN
jgi:uncharacterized protein (TIGR02145 family)